MREKNRLWYTLTELLVIIAIIWILALVVTSFDFSRLNARQNIAIEVVKIESIISEVRDNALVWRWSEATNSIPVSWSIDITSSWSSSIQTSYLTWASASPINYDRWSWSAQENNSIVDLRCEDFLWNTSSTWSVSLGFTGSKIAITRWCESTTRNYKIMNIVYGQWSLTWSVSLNTVTGTITTN